jgi:hypothetical protein
MQKKGVHKKERIFERLSERKEFIKKVKNILETKLIWRKEDTPEENSSEIKQSMGARN